MRLFKLLSLLSLLFGARGSSHKTREPAPHPLDAHDLLDMCASVNADLNVPDLLGVLSLVGVIDVCLCISALPIFIQTNAVAFAAVGKAKGGAPTVIAILTDLINDKAARSGCHYPDHSIPICVDGNPCGFDCTDGFKASPPDHPKRCVCEAPSVICNGECGPARTCPSSAPSKKKDLKKRWVGSGICAGMGPEWAACGVIGGGARSWECIDTARDLESCGGCMLPLTPYVPIGQDCTSLPGVADVACISGECVVRHCLPGYVLARDGTHCVSRHGKISQHSGYDEHEVESVPARVYGLEHVPLRKRKH